MGEEQEQKFHQLTEEPVSRMISHLAVPCIISMLVTAFMAESSGTADKEAVFGLLLFSGKALSFSIFEVYLTANFPQ